MTDNETLIQHFYKSFQGKDYRAMQSCYHEEVVFSDPVFPNLNGKQVKAMWHLLIAAGKDLKLEFSRVEEKKIGVHAHWEAWYTFSATGKKVHNVIDATFVFKDGKIIRHTDHFNFWRWSRMALGVTGWLLGWSTLLKKKISTRAKQNLEKFIAANPEYGEQ